MRKIKVRQTASNDRLELSVCAKWYTGVVKAVDKAAGTCDVQFDDNDSEEAGVRFENVRGSVQARP